MPRAYKEVVDEISQRTWRLGASILLSPAEYVEVDGFKCSGYLDPAPAIPLLAVAAKLAPEHVLGVLLHEYCHLTQLVEQCSAWVEASKYDDKNQFEWVRGKNISGMSTVIDAVREMEADNERRTFRLIKELDAPLDLEDYCRKANAYLHFHNVLKEQRVWYKEPGALYVPEIISLCNSTIDTKFTKTPPKLYNAIIKYATNL